MQNNNDDEKTPYDYSDENVRRGSGRKDDIEKIEDAAKDEDMPKESGSNPRLGQKPDGGAMDEQGTGLDLNQGENMGKVPAG